jgi:hypothetical protein
MRTPPSSWVLLPLGFSLFACGGDDLVAPQARALALISGDGQPARAGQELGAPFVVRVTDHRGNGVESVLVRWTVLSGEGILDEGRGSEGFERCPPPTTNSRTDADGFARISFMPTWFGPTTVAAEMVHVEAPPVLFFADASDPGAVVTIMAGNHQEGKAGTWLPDDLWVRVTDGRGDPVGNIEVAFAVTSGAGSVGGCGIAGKNPAWGITRTLPEGLGINGYDHGFAGIPFWPSAQGITTVAAAVAGVQVSPVTFTVNGHGVFIRLLGDPSTDEVGFLGPDRTSDVTVPVGAPVEWVNLNWVDGTARIMSTATPQGGAAFDSGELDLNFRFEFVPAVAGTWEFVDLVSGVTGTLTAG